MKKVCAVFLTGVLASASIVPPSYAGFNNLSNFVNTAIDDARDLPEEPEEPEEEPDYFENLEPDVGLIEAINIPTEEAGEVLYDLARPDYDNSFLNHTSVNNELLRVEGYDMKYKLVITTEEDGGTDDPVRLEMAFENGNRDFLLKSDDKLDFQDATTGVYIIKVAKETASNLGTLKAINLSKEGNDDWTVKRVKLEDQTIGKNLT